MEKISINKKGQVEDQADFLIALIILVVVLVVTVSLVNDNIKDRGVVINSVEENLLLKDFLFNFLRNEINGEKVSSKIVDYCGGGDKDLFDGLDTSGLFNKFDEITQTNIGKPETIIVGQAPVTAPKAWSYDFCLEIECKNKKLNFYEGSIKEFNKAEESTCANKLAGHSIESVILPFDNMINISMGMILK